jgi:hypothetical protein
MIALPISASPSLSGCTIAPRNRIMADLIAAATAQERAVREPHMKTRLDPNNDGWSTSNQSASPTTPSSTNLSDANKTSSSAPLQQPSEKEDF